MKSRNLAPRLLALVLAVSIAFPSPVLALRPAQRERRAQTVGLEESLRTVSAHPTPDLPVPTAPVRIYPAVSGVWRGDKELLIAAYQQALQDSGVRRMIVVAGIEPPTIAEVRALLSDVDPNRVGALLVRASQARRQLQTQQGGLEEGLLVALLAQMNAGQPAGAVTFQDVLIHIGIPFAGILATAGALAGVILAIRNFDAGLWTLPNRVSDPAILETRRQRRIERLVDALSTADLLVPTGGETATYATNANYGSGMEYGKDMVPSRWYAKLLRKLAEVVMQDPEHATPQRVNALLRLSSDKIRDQNTRTALERVYLDLTRGRPDLRNATFENSFMGSNSAGLEENKPIKLTWRAWWATRRLWSETSKSLRLLSRENQWPARGLINGMLNRAVQKRVPTEYLLRFGVPVLLKPYQDMETLKNSLIGLERFNDRLAQAQKLVWEKISGGEYSRLTLEAVLFNSQKSDYRIEIKPEESHDGITRYWGPDGLLSEEQARGVEYSDGLSGSDYAPDKPPGYYYQNYMPVARVTERVIDSPQVVRLIRAGDMSGLEETTGEKLTWGAWWTTLGYRGATQQALANLDPQFRDAQTGQVNHLINQLVERGFSPIAILEGAIPSLLRTVPAEKLSIIWTSAEGLMSKGIDPAQVFFRTVPAVAAITSSLPEDLFKPGIENWALLTENLFRNSASPINALHVAQDILTMIAPPTVEPQRFLAAMAFVGRLANVKMNLLWGTRLVPAVYKASPTIEKIKGNLDHLESLVFQLAQRDITPWADFALLGTPVEDLKRQAAQLLRYPGGPGGALVAERHLRAALNGLVIEAIWEMADRMAREKSPDEFTVGLILLSDLSREPGVDWFQVAEPKLTQLLSAAVELIHGGFAYRIEINRPGSGPAQTIRLIQGERILPDGVGWDGASGLEEKSTRQNMPFRFLVDTGKGEAGVLRLLELAVQLRLQTGLAVQAAGVATEEEAAAAEAAMPDDVSRESLRSRVFTYTPGDEESHQIALALAETSVPGLVGIHPELIITEMNRSTVTWFLQALQRLGVTRLTQEMFDRVESYLTAA